MFLFAALWVFAPENEGFVRARRQSLVAAILHTFRSHLEGTRLVGHSRARPARMSWNAKHPTRFCSGPSRVQGPAVPGGVAGAAPLLLACGCTSIFSPGPV